MEGLKDLLVEGRGSVADVLAPYGLSTLLLAVMYEQAEIHQLLLSAGASRAPFAHSSYHSTHLRVFWRRYTSQDYCISASDILADYVSFMDSHHHAKLLSRVGIEPILESHAFTRLHKCVLGLTSEPLESILSNSNLLSEINATDSLGRTALHLAATRCNDEAIRFLLDWGALLDIRDQCGKTPLHVAVGLDSVSTTAAIIASGVDLEIRDQFGNTALHQACLLGYQAIAALLLDAGANIESTNGHLETPLRQAVLADHLEVARLLHERGAAFTTPDGLGTPSIHKAVWFNSHHVLRFLLGLQIKVDQKCFNGRTVLHILADSGDAQTMQIFLGVNLQSLAKVNFNDTDERGYTAMDYLMARKNSDELLQPFRKVLAHIKSYHRKNEQDVFEELDALNTTQGAEEVDFFSDALETQSCTSD